MPRRSVPGTPNELWETFKNWRLVKLRKNSAVTDCRARKLKSIILTRFNTQQSVHSCFVKVEARVLCNTNYRSSPVVFQFYYHPIREIRRKAEQETSGTYRRVWPHIAFSALAKQEAVQGSSRPGQTGSSLCSSTRRRSHWSAAFCTKSQPCAFSWRYVTWIWNRSMEFIHTK